MSFIRLSFLLKIPTKDEIKRKIEEKNKAVGRKNIASLKKIRPIFFKE